MLPRNYLLHRRLLRQCGGGGGGGGGSSRALSYNLSFQHDRAPSPAPPPRFHPFRTSPPPSAATPGGGSASVAWPLPASSHPPPRPYNPMVPYLVRACGFSFDEALEASELLSGKKRHQNPDFSAASGCGQSPLETQIGWLVSSASLAPGGGGGGEKKNGAVEGVGFSGRTLAQFMLLDPGVLTGVDVARRVGFWSALFRAEADLLRALESNTTHSLGSAPKEKVLRKMILLRGCGVPNRDLRALLRNESAAVARCVDSMETLIKRVEELGLAHGHEAAYVYALQVIDKMTKRKLEYELGDTHKIVGRGREKKASQALRNSFQFPVDPARNAGKVMDVSLKEGRVETPSAPAQSLPLALSLEKKAMPPYYILQVLRSKNYPSENQASYLLRMCKKARLWTNSYASMNREFQSFMRLSSLLVQGRIAT